ncbi:NUDIX hydrolase [Cupriavidus sp. KB_39]|uniref:NUDIX hydrolase n=1 Tax=Cupriavidus sp. KB_39 TaxID=3233036 RepID=UPI003F8F660C
MQRKPKVRATVICVRGDKVLLVAKARSKWALPGGKPSDGESFQATATRELHEETCLMVKEVTYLFQFIGVTTVHHVFAATVEKKANAQPSNEIRQCQWVSRDAFGEADTSVTTQSIVEAYFGARRR